MYKRVCPACKKELIYKTKHGFLNAVQKNACCVSCARSGNKISILKQPEKWIRVCENCQKTRIFKSFHSWYQSKGVLCVSCSQKNHPGHPHTEKHKKYMSKLLKGRKITWSDKIKNSHWARNEALRKTVSENQSKRMSFLLSSGQIKSHPNRGFKFGRYISEKTKELNYYRSSYELRRMQELDDDDSVVRWTTKHKIRIPYKYENKSKNYVPDFLIEKTNGSCVIEEVKGWVVDAKQLNSKIRAAKKYCKHRDMIFIMNYMDHS